MRTSHVMAIGAVILGFSAAAFADEIPGIPTAGPVSMRLKHAPSTAQAVAEILRARDPSSVVEAYVRARTKPDRTAVVTRAYVRRMADLGYPELAETQAKDVLTVEITEPVSKAVIAAMRAKRGEADKAIAGIATAVMFGPEEPFVRRTAGQILAWRDTREGVMSEDLESTLDTMRRSVANTPEYKEAYGTALKAYLAARTSKPAPERPQATLVADSVPPEYEYDGENVIYTTGIALWDGNWDFWSPAYWGSYCFPSVRAHSVCSDFRGYGRGAYRSAWYGGGRLFITGRAHDTWTTPLGGYSWSSGFGRYYTQVGGYSGGYCGPAYSRGGAGWGRSYGSGRGGYGGGGGGHGGNCR